MNNRAFFDTLAFKGLILVLVPILFQLIFVFWLLSLINEAESSYLKELQPYDLASRALQLPALSVIGTLALTKYKHRQDAQSLQYFETIYMNLKRATDDLSQWKGYCDIEQKDRIVSDSDRVLQVLKTYRDELIDSKNLDKSTFNFKQSTRILTARLFGDVDALTKSENAATEIAIAEKASAKARIEVGLAVGIVLSFMTSCALAAYFTLEISRRIDRIVKNTVLLAQSQPLLEQDESTDEIGDLDRVFHEIALSLERAMIEKRDFMVLMSEQLKKPLVESKETLRSFSRGTFGPINEKGQVILSKSLRTTRRLIGLIGELLDVEQIEAPTLVLDISEVELSTVVAQSIDSVQSLADRKGVMLESAPTDVTIYADEQRLVRVITNLMSNAIKYSPEDSSVVVAVESRPSSIKITVRDQGPGVPQEKQTAIFEKFQQVDPMADTRVRKGTGLGLPICKMIVEAHGGTIGLDSTEGAGSCFWFELPMVTTTAS